MQFTESKDIARLTGKGLEAKHSTCMDRPGASSDPKAANLLECRETLQSRRTVGCHLVEDLNCMFGVLSMLHSATWTQAWRLHSVPVRVPAELVRGPSSKSIEAGANLVADHLQRQQQEVRLEALGRCCMLTSVVGTQSTVHV